MSIFFISDLHLSPYEEAIGNLFLQFMEEYSNKMDGLYILGDLFDAWIGDDAVDPAFDDYINAIKTLDCPVYFLPGNRDFLVSKTFEQLLGCTILEDPIKAEFFGEQILLSHGDIFCTDDKEYQHFRQLVRNPHWQTDFLSKTIDERLEMAKQLRTISQEKSQYKSQNIMDVNTNTVDRYMDKFAVKRLIHGHTHRMQHHHLQDNRERIVLGDWSATQGNYLLVNATELAIKTYSPSL